MAYTETKTTSYGSRVSSSFKSIGTGLVLLVMATCLLWWNEGRSVHTSQDIKEVGKTAVHVDDINKLADEGDLIHANGTASTTETLSDATFGVSVNALSLDRAVEYYQWVEHSRTETKDKIGGSQEEITTYTYQLEWVEMPINSNDFHDPAYRGRNQTLANINFEDQTVYPERVTFGAYTMPESFIAEVASCSRKSNAAINFNPETLKELNASIARTQPRSAQSTAAAATAEPDTVGFDNSYEWVHASADQLYFGRNVSTPALGDVRVKFTVREPSAVISLIAVVSGDSFIPYHTKNKADRKYITSGTKSIEQMMDSAEEVNNFWTWGLRILGILLVCAALKMVFGLLVTILKVLPFLANILNWGVNLICNILGVAYSLIVIGIAWIFYRPVLAVILLAVAGGLIYWLVIGKKKSAPAADPAAGQ